MPQNVVLCGNVLRKSICGKIIYGKKTLPRSVGLDVQTDMG